MIDFQKKARTEKLLWALSHLQRDTAFGRVIEAIYLAQQPESNGRFLRHGLFEVTPRDLAENTRMSTVMCATRVTALAEKGIVKRRRDGRSIWVTMDYEFLVTMHHAIKTGDIVGFSTLQKV